MSKIKIMAVASTGGHYVQLSRIISVMPLLGNDDVLRVRTKMAESDQPGFFNEVLIEDVSRSNFWLAFLVLFQLCVLVFKHRPAWILTTGALPGLIAIIVGRFFMINTIWVDSIANTKKISMSGSVAKYFAHQTLTQWPELADKKVMYKGQVI